MSNVYMNKSTNPRGVLFLFCILFLCCSLVSCSGLPKAPGPDDLTGAEQMERVKSLVGTWYPADGEPDADPIAIYRLSANDNSVVERLFPDQMHEMVTMYFINDGELTLTHFCSLSNQPTMVAEPGTKDEIWFRFSGITNLGDRNNPHMREHAFNFFEDPNRLDATWVLWEKNQEKAQNKFSMLRR